tara:strand:+ start:1619 stop:3739 length:2121 start_codon:yes stop_codon:yes gene_type:complete
MESSKKSLNDRTAFHLAKKCYTEKKKTKKNMCLENVVNFLKSDSWDIICLQEATNWLTIYKKLSLVKSYLNYCNFNISGVDVTVFYNSEKLKVDALSGGNLKEGDKRPFEVIYFNYLPKDENFILINLHNGHLIEGSKIENSINLSKYGYLNSKNLNNIILSDNQGNKELSKNILINNKNYKSENLSSLRKKSSEESRIILVGDFNDHGKYDYWKKGLDIYGVKVDSKNKKPPNSCCTPVSNHYLWLGAPSFVYNLNLRKKIMGINPQNYIFDITTFNSTACIRESNNLSMGNLCNSYKNLEKKCNSINYRSHEAFSKRLKKFIKNPKEMTKKIKAEYKARKKVNKNNPFQRYNELLIYFYPWEMIGVEVGGRKPEISIELYNKLTKNFNNFKTDYKKILDDNKEINQMLTKINSSNINSDLTYSKLSLWRYFKEYKCSMKKDVTRENFILILEKIINQLEKPLYYFEYGKVANSNFYDLSIINPINGKPYRNTTFDLFSQVADSNMLTHINSVRAGRQSIKRKSNNNRKTRNKKNKFRTDNLLPKNIKSKVNNNFNLKSFEKNNKYPLAIRSLIIDKSTGNQSIDINDAIKQVFDGKVFNGKFNIIANPATALGSESNVIFTSQIFDRRYKQNPLINHGNTYKKYGKSTVVPIRSKKFNNDIMLGDYLLIGKGFNFKKNNLISKQFKPEKLTSDHLPVESTVSFN